MIMLNKFFKIVVVPQTFNLYEHICIIRFITIFIRNALRYHWDGLFLFSRADVLLIHFFIDVAHLVGEIVSILVKTLLGYLILILIFESLRSMGLINSIFLKREIFIVLVAMWHRSMRRTINRPHWWNKFGLLIINKWVNKRRCLTLNWVLFLKLIHK
jgi:hypothetical protein